MSTDSLLIRSTPEPLSLPASELSWTAARSSGPGGQNVNKVSSKVELHFDFEHSTVLDLPTKARLRALGASHLDAAGRLRITSQATRDQSRNLDDARSKLADLVRRALERPRPRKKTKPSRGAKERRLQTKKKVGEKKQGRGRAAGGDD
jgi:ribosome-associated protein